MERRFQNQYYDEFAIMVPLHNGLFGLKMWREENLICDVVANRQQVDMLLEDFSEIDEDLVSFREGKLDLDFGGG